jgi:hypothetical protein
MNMQATATPVLTAKMICRWIATGASERAASSVILYEHRQKLAGLEG